MKKILSIILVAIGILIATNSWAVIVTGTGNNREEAINNGLRATVEMYTGSLVYGVTEVENFQLKKDEIVASSMGYIKNYKVIKTSNIDDLIIVTLDVTLSEDKIDKIVRENVKFVTTDDILRDFNNVSQRQEQIRKFAEMVKILASRPISEKYFVTYDGYEVKRIGMTEIDIIVKTRVGVNPFYSRAYNEILKNLSDKNDSFKTKTLGGNYRMETGKLVNTKYYVTTDANIPNINEVKAQIHINKVPVDSCREYRDNLMLVIDPAAYAIGLMAILKDMSSQSKDEDPKAYPKYDNAAIQKSKILPPEGLPISTKINIKSADGIKMLKNLKLTMDRCYYKNE
jgi:hypothetical protein